ncbi:uncharacterized protein LOC133369590 [Rhineura floridana]|uniref:uncharacterized protein LOC133369590 n=1 Tax=Rhineura floridana TaxID=261503 RepID=UPI002AC7EF1C|nr:uncharacterized protein LOC133369590 [Rhineura floridana]
MGSFMIRQGTGPPGDKVAFSRSSSKAKRIALSPHLGLVTVAKRQTWQTVLAIVPLLFASTAAYSESHSAATYQTPPGTKPGSSDSLPFQNLANGWQLTEQDWQNQSTNGPLWLPTGRDPYATNLSANTVVTVDWTPVANTLQDSNDIHGNTESGAGGQGPLSVGSPALQMDQDSSKNLDHAASLTVDALAKTTDTSLTLSSKGFKQPEITMTLLSLVSQAKGTGKMPLAYTMGRTATFPPILPFPDTSSSFHLDTNATLQTASASQNIASATDQPTAADTATLSSEKTLAVEHIPRIDQDFHGTWLSLTEMVYRTSVNRITAGHSSAVPSTQIDFLNGQHRKKEASSLTSISTETLIDSLQDSMTSPVGTTPGTTNIGMKLLCSSSGDVAHSSLTSRLHTSANILPGSPSQSSDASSSKTYSDQTIVHNVQELGTTKLVSRRPSAAVSATLSQSSILPSLSYPGEALTPVTLPAVITLAGFTGSRKPSRFSTHQQLEPLSTGLPLHRPIPTTAESPYASVLSTAADGAHVNPEVPLSSVFPYRRSKSTIPPIYGLSSTVALTSFSSQPSMAEYTMQGSQLSKAELPSGNVTLPVSPNLTESSALVSNSAIIQLAVETTTHVPPSSAGVPGFGLSLATTLSDLVTHTEVSLSVGLQSSQLKEQAANLDSTSLAPYLATTKEDTLTTVGMANASLAEGSSLELKEDGSLVPEEHIGPSEASTQDTISKGKSGMTYIVSSFLHWQASSSPPLSTLYSRRAETGHNVPLQTGPSEAGMLEGATTTASYRKQITELHKRTDQTPAAAKLMPIFSEPPVMASQGTTPEDLAFSLTSAEPPVEPTGAHYAWPNRSGAMSSRPPNTTSLATSRIKLMSKEPSEPETLAVSLATKMASDYIVHMFTAGNDTTLLSRPFLETAGVTLPVGEASARMAHTDLLAGGPTGRPAVEPLSTTSHEWKLAIPTPSRATASLAYITEPGRSLVTPAHDSISTGFTSIGSSRSSIPESALEINFEATQGLMGRKEQVVPTNTMLPSISSEETWTHDLKATTSQTMASTTYRTPPLAPEVDFSASAVTATLGTILGYKVTDAFTVAVPEVISTMALQSYSPRYREFSGSKAPADLSVVESKSTQAVPVSSVTTNLLTNLRTFFDKSSKSTAGAACRSASCMTSTIPASFTPSQSTLLLPTASQLLLTRKALVSPLGSTDAVKNGTTAILGTKVTSPGESGATEQMVPVTQGDHTSKQPVTKFKAPTMSQFTRSENLTFSTPVSPLLAVHHLPLQFRLTRIDYEESLENKSSQSYKKLEKEVKLTLNKMLSTYESFLQTNILNFWNGSVIVESVALFQVGGPVPTPSDIIRTVVTEVEKKEMDTFFHWRVDVKSLRSKGFSLQNLEPEKLAVSFTVLGLGSSAFFGDMINWEHLERLRNKVSLLLGARYTVQNLSLDQAGNSQGGIDLNGEIYIDTAIHVDVGWALQVLMELKNYSVDLTSLLINGSRLSLQVFPVSFLVTNRIFSERMMDRSSVEHQNLARDISNTLMHVLGKYKNLLQVAIRDITGGSLICHGDVIFQHPAPTSKDILQTLALSVGPKDYLDSSNLQVDPFSFNVAGDGLEPPSRNMGVPGYAVAIIVLCGLALIALPILALLPKMLGRREKIIINRGHDPEAGMETFELDNAGFHSTLDEIYSRRSENTEA